MKLLGIVGCITPGSKTKVLVDETLKAAKNINSDISIEILELYDYNVQFCDGRNPNDYHDDTKKVIDMVKSADAYIIGTPIYQGSLTGALKNLFDLVPVEAFRHKAVGFVANGGTYQHFLVIENQLKPIFGYFRSLTAPGYVYAHSDHFNSQKEIIDEEVQSRINDLAKEVTFIHKNLVVKDFIS